MSISKATIETVRDRAHIEEIVKRYVPSLAKRGKNYLGLCPFHKEKTPSFTVSTDKQIFYCFGCHTGGNVFTFISKIEKLNFPDSVRHLGNLLGITVEEESSEKKDTFFAQYKKINQEAARQYHRYLKSPAGKTGLDYLLDRGVNMASIEQFGLGLAPDSWNFITNHFQNLKVNPENLLSAGLISVSDKNNQKRYYDRFRNRIMFPITNPREDIVAFGGRIIGNGEPKYLNTPETEYYKKGTILYGFPQARESISELKRAIIVEGYLDVIGCHQNGVKNVVAPLGTALTVNQIDLLLRYCTEIVLLFDSDSAGVKASLRSIDLLEERNVDIKIAQLPFGDPFEFLNAKNVREFMAIVDSALKPVDYKIHRIISLNKSGDKIKVLKSLFPILREIRYETERTHYLGLISRQLSINESDLRSDYSRFFKGAVPERVADTASSGKGEKIDFLARGYRDLVILLINYPELMEQAVIDFSEYDIADPVAGSIFTRLCEFYSKGEPISIGRFYDIFQEGEEKVLLDKTVFKEFQVISPMDVYTEIYINIKKKQIEDKLKGYFDLIQMKGSNPEYMAEIEVLRREKEKLSSFIYNKNVK